MARVYSQAHGADRKREGEKERKREKEKNRTHIIPVAEAADVGVQTTVVVHDAHYWMKCLRPILSFL
jgi:hypothetical protein